MKHRGALAAAALAVTVPLGAVLVAHQGGRENTGCAVRYAAVATGLRLTVTLQQPGSVEVRAGGRVVARQNEPAGDSTITAPATGTPGVTEFTADGQLVACAVAAG